MSKWDDSTLIKHTDLHAHEHTQARMSGAQMLISAVSGVTQKVEREVVVGGGVEEKRL